MSMNNTLFRFGTDDGEGAAGHHEHVQESDVKDILAITRP